jgi:glycosyltransferase involved in cell wall biosynthesis
MKADKVEESAEMVRPIRIVRIIDRLNIGGPAKHVVWLTAGLDPARFQTTLITGTIPPGEGDMAYFAAAAGVHPVVIKEMSRELSPRDLLVIVKLLFKLRELKPDVIHTHKAKAGAAGRVAAWIYKWATPSGLLLRPRRAVVLHTYHGHIFYGYYSAAKTRVFLLIEQLLAKLCTDRIVVLSAQQKQEISGKFKVGRPEQFQIVPLGIEFSEIDSAEAGNRSSPLRNEINAAQSDILIGIVGRLCEVKNQSMFIKAAAVLNSTLGEVATGAEHSTGSAKFIVIGDGPLRRALEEEATAAGLAGSVHFAGFREDVGSLYRDLDIVALTSLNEGTPLTIIEAFAAGRPVVASEVGGVIDLMGALDYQADGLSVRAHGITVPTGDTKAFAKALKFLMASPDLRARMGATGKAFATSRMSKDRLIKDIDRLYCKMLMREPTVSEVTQPAISLPDLGDYKQ